MNDAAMNDAAMNDAAVHRKYDRSLVARWLGVYVGLVAAPMVLALLGPLPGSRSWWTEFGVGLGFIAIGMLAVQFVVSGRIRRVAPTFGTDILLQFHRRTGVIALGLVLAHPLVLVLSDSEYVSFFDPTVNLPRAAALSVVVAATVLLLATSLRREMFRLQYEWWRAAHGALAGVILMIGIVHGIQVSHYLDPTWKQAIWIVGLGGALWLLPLSRLVRPMSARTQPYRVTSVRVELPDVISLRFRPDGHAGMAFDAGQFAWITLADSPLRLQQHPFSFSSSADDDEIEFTAKVAGDFTATLADVEIGSTGFLEGPYGGFTLDHGDNPVVLLAGGIGITPILSILRTAADRGDSRAFVLLYGTVRVDRAPFRDELARLGERLDLTVHHVLEEPPPGWDGETGFIDGDMIARRVPVPPDRCEYFICGPEPMMDACESGVRSLGVSWRQIYTERFQVV
jgi:predicted ferric reductase